MKKLLSALLLSLFFVGTLQAAIIQTTQRGDSVYGGDVFENAFFDSRHGTGYGANVMNHTHNDDPDYGDDVLEHPQF